MLRMPSDARNFSLNFVPLVGALHAPYCHIAHSIHNESRNYLESKHSDFFKLSFAYQSASSFLIAIVQ